MNLKEKIKKSFSPCKRLKLLEYEEFLEKEEMNDSPTSRAMYCEYKSQVEEKNQKADMCLSQKIGSFLFAIVLTLVIICLFVNQVSASVYVPQEALAFSFTTDAVSQNSAIVVDAEPYTFEDYSYSFDIRPLICYAYNGGFSTSFYITDIEAFQGLCEYRQISTYAQWQNYVADNYPSYDIDEPTHAPLNGYYLDSNKFLTALNYQTITQTDLENAKKEGVSDSIDVVSDLLNSMGILYEPYLNNGSLSTLDSMLSENIGLGLQSANTMGYNSGLARGETVFRESQEFQDILDNEYQKGKNKGEETAPLVESSLRSFFNAPINFISNILNFEIFGINLWAVFTFILTLGLVFFIIKKVVGL